MKRVAKSLVASAMVLALVANGSISSAQEPTQGYKPADDTSLIWGPQEPPYKVADLLDPFPSTGVHVPFYGWNLPTDRYRWGNGAESFELANPTNPDNKLVRTENGVTVTIEKNDAGSTVFKPDQGSFLVTVDKDVKPGATNTIRVIAKYPDKTYRAFTHTFTVNPEQALLHEPKIVPLIPEYEKGIFPGSYARFYFSNIPDGTLMRIESVSEGWKARFTDSGLLDVEAPTNEQLRSRWVSSVGKVKLQFLYSDKSTDVSEFSFPIRVLTPSELEEILNPTKTTTPEPTKTTTPEPTKTTGDPSETTSDGSTSPETILGIVAGVILSLGVIGGGVYWFIQNR